MRSLESRYRVVWLVLLGLMGLSVAASSMGMSYPALTAFIFLVAAVKATLVMREFMHFKGAPIAIILAVASPIFLFVAMLVLMYPDFVGVRSGAEFLR